MRQLVPEIDDAACLSDVGEDMLCRTVERSKGLTDDDELALD